MSGYNMLIIKVISIIVIVSFLGIVDANSQENKCSDEIVYIDSFGFDSNKLTQIKTDINDYSHQMILIL